MSFDLLDVSHMIIENDKFYNPHLISNSWERHQEGMMLHDDKLLMDDSNPLITSENHASR